MNLLHYFENILYIIPGILLGFVFHEYAHARVADFLGDPTPRNQNKLNLRPHTHVDIIGILLIIIVGIGWAKPIETNRSYLKKPRRDSILISLAGPLSNLLIAVVICFIIKIFETYNILNYDINSLKSNINGVHFLSYLLITIMIKAIYVNMMLFIFNLIPLPPLDGFHVIENLIPPRFYKQLAFLNQYGFVFLIILLFMFSKFLTPFISGSANYLLSIFNINVSYS